MVSRGLHGTKGRGTRELRGDVGRQRPRASFCNVADGNRMLPGSVVPAGCGHPDRVGVPVGTGPSASNRARSACCNSRVVEPHWVPVPWFVPLLLAAMLTLSGCSGNSDRPNPPDDDDSSGDDDDGTGGDDGFFGYGQIGCAGRYDGDQTLGSRCLGGGHQDGAGQRIVFGQGKALDQGLGGVCFKAGRQHLRALLGDALGDGQDLFAGLALAEDDLGKTGAQGAVVVDVGKAQIFKGQVPELFQGLIRREVPRGDACEQLADLFLVHGRGSFGHNREEIAVQWRNGLVLLLM